MCRDFAACLFEEVPILLIEAIEASLVHNVTKSEGEI